MRRTGRRRHRRQRDTAGAGQDWVRQAIAPLSPMGPRAHGQQHRLEVERPQLLTKTRVIVARARKQHHGEAHLDAGECQSKGEDEEGQCEGAVGAGVRKASEPRNVEQNQRCNERRRDGESDDRMAKQKPDHVRHCPIPRLE